MASLSYDYTDLARHYVESVQQKTQHCHAHDSAVSVATYASTVHSQQDIDTNTNTNTTDHVSSALPPFRKPWTAPSPLSEQEKNAYTIGDMLAESLPATPSDFAALFPSTRKLIIHHDHSTRDGNMNLRADVLIRTPAGDTCPLSLYHLRMRDLRTRDCSLRRYERDSGREVCQASAAVKRKPWEKEARREEGWRGSLSSVIHHLGKSKKEKASPSIGSSRRDSGYGSLEDEEEEEEEEEKTDSHPPRIAPVKKNEINLEFSNYAHVDINRKRMGKMNEKKRYEFEYWGVTYSWQRVKSADPNDMNYQLMDHESNQAVAHIAGIPLTDADAYDEVVRGSWIPPCSLWISDGTCALKKEDVADVVVATGMMCLVDGWVRKRFEV